MFGECTINIQEIQSELKNRELLITKNFPTFAQTQEYAAAIEKCNAALAYVSSGGEFDRFEVINLMEQSSAAYMALVKKATLIRV